VAALTVATLGAELPMPRPLAAQAVRVLRVVDTSASPIAGATIDRPTGGRAVRTAGDGRARVSDAGEGELRVRAMGFVARRVRLAFASDSEQIVVLAAQPTVLPLVVTSIGQRTERLGESSRSVVVVDRAAIASAAAVGINQALRSQAGLQELPSPPSKSSIAIRGLDGARVLVLIDGDPVPGALVESRDIGRLSAVSVERIEVTKGPSSVEFGSDAIGGVINIVSAAPSAAFTSEFTARTGALGRNELSATSSATRGRVGARVGGGVRQVDRVLGYDAAGSTFHRVYDGRADVRIALGDTLRAPHERWELRANGVATQERQRFPIDGQFNGFIDDVSGQGFVELRGPTAGGAFRSRVFAQHFEYRYRQSRGLLPIRKSADSVTQREAQQRALVAWTRTLGGHTLDVGAQFSHRSLSAPGKLDGARASDAVRELFARDRVSFGAVTVDVGARGTHSSLWGDAVNPSVGAVWNISDRWRWRATVARGFRAPGFKEMRYTFFNPAGGYTLVGNPALQPEHSVATSSGVSWTPWHGVWFDGDVYRNDVAGLIDWRFQGVNAAGAQTYAQVNTARARTQGIELSARVERGHAMLSGGYDYLWARDRDSGLPLNRRAAHSARVNLAQRWRGGILSDVTARYIGRAALIGVPIGAPISGPVGLAQEIVGWQGAFMSADVQLRAPLRFGAELSVGANNVLNQQPAFWTPAYARQWFVGMTWRRGGPVG
jgi:outer membrane receptor for ferrienterochelin and colicins